MKRFLVVLVGDGDNYLYPEIVGELNKSGEKYVGHMIFKLTGNIHVEQPYDNSTMRYVYNIVHADNRKVVEGRETLELMYKSAIQQYNEKNNA